MLGPPPFRIPSLPPLQVHKIILNYFNDEEEDMAMMEQPQVQAGATQFSFGDQAPGTGGNQPLQF